MNCKGIIPCSQGIFLAATTRSVKTTARIRPPCFTVRWLSATTVWKPVTSVLKEQINEGVLHPDKAQERAARRLDRLQQAIEGYDNAAHIQFVQELRMKQEEQDRNTKNTENTNQDKVNETMDSVEDETTTTSAREEPPPPPLPQIPRGLFLHGNVGTGKSMLMDTFYQYAPTEKKRRVHFHSFLQDVHKRIYALKQQDLQTFGRDFSVNTSIHRNPIYRVAQQLASEVTLLCFDEFQVTDVADALILKQLFEGLFQCGTVVLATSNRAPSHLYEGGLNRSYFLPFIDLLQDYCTVHEVKSSIDYRTLLSEDLDEFFLVDTNDFKASSQQCHNVFTKLLQGNEPISMEIESAFNRTVPVRHAHPDESLVARFQFDELCNRELGSSDYRAIAEQFDIVILEEIPFLTLKDHDQARRFITLVDELYEGNCALFCSAVAFPDKLFLDGTSSAQATFAPDSVEAKVGEMFGIDVAQSSGKTVGELASVRELSFAFRRAASRLTQMSSRQRWDRVLQVDE